MSAYAELATTTNFSFLRGASHPEEFCAQALALGHVGIGIADRNSVAGVVRAHAFLRVNEIAPESFKLAAGARLVFADETPDLLCYPKDRAAWGRLCRLLTRGNMRAKKGACLLRLDDLLEHCEGQRLIALGDDEPPPPLVSACRDWLWLAATVLYDPQSRARFHARRRMAQRLGLRLIAVNDVLMHDPGRGPLADVVACIREGVTLEAAGALVAANCERHLKSADEMTRLFRESPEAVGETVRFLRSIEFKLSDLSYNYPSELREGYASEHEALEAFAREGALSRYPQGVPESVSRLLDHELKLVRELDYAAYFLTVHDIVRFARRKGVLAQGRGSAANSVICFCLGITEVDPTKHDLLFERFVSAARKEPPDIDVDFEHERRELVIQYIYERFGRNCAGLACAVVTYRGKSAIREVGKAFGLSSDLTGRLSHLAFGRGAGEDRALEIRKLGLDPTEPRFAMALALTEELHGFPRHLTQHSGGFVITRERLDEIAPVAPAAMEGRTVIEWDKDDLDALGILKIDVLALGMLTCLQKGLDLVAAHYGRRYRLSTIPEEDQRVYAMISRADTVGVFQIESRAQMSMLPRLKPACFYDLVIEVAIVRPGPIQGDMVHPYLRRRTGREPVSYPSPELEQVLGKTLGVPLFQEQAMKLAIVAAGFSPEEADRLRRSMATFKRSGLVGQFRDKMVEGMAARGYDREFADRCFRQIEGFGTYGFPESHAASFALLVYASAWLKCRYPDVFACALLNSQPMGFYASAQILRDAEEHGIGALPVDVNASHWDCTLESAACVAREPHPRHADMRDDRIGDRALRLGFRQVKGLAREDMERLVDRRGRGYDSVRDLWLRAQVSPSALERLAEADAFASLGLRRRDALWAVGGLNRAGDRDDLPLLRDLSFEPREADAHLPPMPPGEEVLEDYRFLRLSLKGHPLAFLRAGLRRRGVVSCAALAALATRKFSTVCGIVLLRQRPGTAKGIIFMTIEDETGQANIIVWPKILEKQRAEILGARLVAVTGEVQQESGVTHLIARRFEDLTDQLRKLQDARGLQEAEAAIGRGRNFQ